MKKWIKILALLTIGLFLCSGTALADYLGTINDLGDNAYWGADPTDGNDRDVIGSTDLFEIWGAEVLLNGSELVVNISTNFVGNQGVFPGLTNDGNGIGYGDLFLSSKWEPYGSSPHYPEDNLNSPTTTTWEYAFSIGDDRWNDSDTYYDGDLYEINDGAILTPEDFLSGGIYRAGQEIAFDTTDLLMKGTGEWGAFSDDGQEDYIRFIIDISGTRLMGSEEIAIHWAMTCGNDVVEGSVPNNPVPEPATMLLLGFGLIGMAGFGRKAFKKKA